MKASECQKLVAILLASFPQSRFNEQTPAAYERMLMDLEYPAASAAVERLLATARFIPTVAEIRETTLALTCGERQPGGEAWGSVLKAIRAQGIHRSPFAPDARWSFRDPVCARCVSALGWEELCSSENQIADRARFIELYDQLAVQTRTQQLSESLPAMQRFRAIEAQRTNQLEPARTGETSASGAMGRLLSIVADASKETA